MHERFAELRSWGLYALVALLVLAPWLGRGYILTLDMIFTPQLQLPSQVSSSYLFYALLHALNFVLPSDVIQKVILFAILFLAGLGLRKLIVQLNGKKPDVAHQISAYFGGIFYMVNPFTYDRFMAGQFAVLLGYALLPWFVWSQLTFLEKPARREAITLAAWAVAISIVSIHSIGLMALLAMMAFAWKLWQQRGDKAWLDKVWKLSLLVLGIFVIASSYWLVPLLTGHGKTAANIASFTAGDQQAFATVGSSAVVKVLNVLRLQGFWAEARNMYNLPQEYVRAWGLLVLMLWTLVITGGVSFWRAKQRFAVWLFGGSALLATFLAVGVFSGWLAAHVPLFAGYREPQKFAAIIALAYGVLAARGMAAVLKRCQQAGKTFLIATSIILLLLPLVWMRAMLWGFSGQLTPVHYPSDWYAMNAQLDEDKSNFNILFLPWHLYMNYGFAGRIIASPAPKFFDKPIIVSNNLEFKGAAPNPDPEASAITPILAAALDQTNLGAKLAKYHIKYIILARENDYTSYNYLQQQTDLHQVSKSATLELYRNEAF